MSSPPVSAHWWTSEEDSDVQLTVRYALSSTDPENTLSRRSTTTACSSASAGSPASGCQVENGGVSPSDADLGHWHSQQQQQQGPPEDARTDAPDVAGGTTLRLATRTYRLHAAKLACACPGYKRLLMPGGQSAAAAHAAGPATAAAAAMSATLSALSALSFPAATPHATGATRDAADGGCGVCGSAAADAGAGSADTVVQLEVHLEEGELDAMETVLRHAYAGLLCDSGSHAADLTPATLLDMMALSLRFDFRKCYSDSCKQLATCSADAYSLPAINHLLSGTFSAALWSYWIMPPAVAAATDRLLHLVGDVEAVCQEVLGEGGTRNPDLWQLDLPSLLVLLDSKRLQARSDNSVLLLADSWMRGSKGAASTAEQQCQVATTLRLGQLSLIFVLDLLPLLPWLRLSPSELGILTCFAAEAPQDGAAGLSVRQRGMVDSKALGGCHTWYAATPAQWCAPGLPPLEMAWDLTVEDLAERLQGAGSDVWYSLQPARFFNGFWVRPCLKFSRDGRAAGVGDVPVEEAHCGVGVSLVCPEGVCLTRSPFVSICASCSVLEAGPDGGWQAGQAWTGIVASGSGVGLLHLGRLPRSPEVLSVKGWAPYLVDGALHIRCTIIKCS